MWKLAFRKTTFHMLRGLIDVVTGNRMTIVNTHFSNI